MIRIITIALILCTSCITTSAQVVKLETFDGQSGNVTNHSVATAVVYETNEQYSLVLTCDHNIVDAKSIKIQSSGRWWPAEVIRRDSVKDLAVLRIMAPNQPTIPLAEKFRPLDQYSIQGYAGEGIPYQRQTQGLQTVNRRTMDPNSPRVYAFHGETPQGVSGGAIKNMQGELVGIVSHSNEVESYGTCGTELGDLLFNVNRVHQTQYSQCRPGMNCYESGSGIQVPRYDDSALNNRITELEKQHNKMLNALNQVKQGLGSDTSELRDLLNQFKEQSTSNAQTINNLKQLIGELTTYDDSSLDARIKALEAKPDNTEQMVALLKQGDERLQAIENGKITINYLNPDGTVFDKEEVGLDDTLNIQPLVVDRHINGEKVGTAVVRHNEKLVLDDGARLVTPE